MSGSEQLEPIEVQVPRPGIVMRALMRPLTLAIVLLLALLVFLCAHLLYTPRLRISPETTYITEPLTNDGTRVDYFAAFEQISYRPEMKTDENGYRLIVRALGPGGESSSEGAGATDRDKFRAREICEKLGLDPAVPPTMCYEAVQDFLTRHVPIQQMNETERAALVDELYERAFRAWTLADLPMMESWLAQHDPVVKLLAEAAQQPHFIIARARPDELERISLFDNDELQRLRSISRILAAHAHYCIGTGDVTAAMGDALACLRLGRHLQRHGGVIELLVGIDIEQAARNIGIAGNPNCPPTADELLQFSAEIAALPAPASLAEALQPERYWLLNFAQGLAHGDLGAEELQLRGHVDATTERVLARLSVDWNVVMREINSCLDRLVEVRGSDFPTTLTARDLLLRYRSRRIATYLLHSQAPSLQMFTEATRRSDCAERLQRIALALLLYEREHGTLPPAHTTDASGKPLHSWRTLLLPYLGQGELYAKLRLDEPWDSPHNREFNTTIVDAYRCPNADLPPGLTNYSVVVGEKTAFGPGLGRTLSSFGPRLLLVVERKQPVMWMDPRSDLTVTEATREYSQHIAGGFEDCPHPSVYNVVLRSGAIHQLPNDAVLAVWQGLLDGTLDHDNY